jgi:hypothetical protein
MKAWEVTSITSFALAGELFFSSGYLLARTRYRLTASFFWAIAMLFFATSILVGGIDHGFFEQKGDSPSRRIILKMTWIPTGMVTFFVLLTAVFQFADGMIRIVAIWVGLGQFIAFFILALRIDEFWIVIANYIPVLILLLVLNAFGIRSGTGSWWMILGVLTTVLASVVQYMGVDAFMPIDRNGLYHIGLMISGVFYFLSGMSLTGYAK